MATEFKDWQPTASIQVLKARAKILAKIRRFFDSRDFFEVETPCISADTVVDRYIEPISVDTNLLGVSELERSDYWLQTSPEFGMKRLIAAGADAIYQICRAFRSNEYGAFHNTEFTMLEWYRVDDDYESGMALLGEFAAEMFDYESVAQTSYHAAFEQHAGISGLSNDISEFRSAAKNRNVEVSTLKESDDVDEWRNLILSQVVEPKLGRQRPEIIFDWPVSQSALAKVRESDSSVAERFELYFQGIELANGYHELTDAKELVLRNQLVNEKRKVDGNVELPEQSRLVSAMQRGFPSCSGVALGIDRLVMLILQESKIQNVIAFPIDRA